MGPGHGTVLPIAYKSSINHSFKLCTAASQDARLISEAVLVRMRGKDSVSTIYDGSLAAKAQSARGSMARVPSRTQMDRC